MFQLHCAEVPMRYAPSPSRAEEGRRICVPMQREPLAMVPRGCRWPKVWTIAEPPSESIRSEYDPGRN
jgi:hypothetical protein